MACPAFRPRSRPVPTQATPRAGWPAEAGGGSDPRGGRRSGGTWLPPDYRSRPRKARQASGVRRRDSGPLIVFTNGASKVTATDGPPLADWSKVRVPARRSGRSVLRAAVSGLMTPRSELLPVGDEPEAETGLAAEVDRHPLRSLARHWSTTSCSGTHSTAAETSFVDRTSLRMSLPETTSGPATRAAWVNVTVTGPFLPWEVAVLGRPDGGQNSGRQDDGKRGAARMRVRPVIRGTSRPGSPHPGSGGSGACLLLESSTFAWRASNGRYLRGANADRSASRRVDPLAGQRPQSTRCVSGAASGRRARSSRSRLRWQRPR